MAKTNSRTSITLKATIYFLFLAITLGCANSARILDEVEAQPQAVANSSEVSDEAPMVSLIATRPSGQIPAAMEDTDLPQPEEEMPDTVVPPVAEVAPVMSPVTLPKGPTPVPATSATVAPITSPVSASPSEPASIPATSSMVAHANPQHPILSFSMHDILGGSHPSARVVTGIVVNSQINGLPFCKPNGGVFPINGGVPILSGNNGIFNNNNNTPFLTGLNGGQNTNTVTQNNGNNNVVNCGNTQPFVTAGQLPGATLQKLMFGSITVIDDEFTEGHELGSPVLGKAQGFYLPSSLDGSSHTIALTTLFQGGHDHEHDIEDTISFLGVHRSASPVSLIAVIGGTGKYQNAKGYATIQTLHQEDQHTTDGIDTVLQFDIYLSH